MSKIETVCPFCKKQIVVEKNSFGVSAFGLNKVQCSHCSKSWEENLGATGSLAKSAPVPSSELAELRAQLNAPFAELLSKLQGLTERRTPARSAGFNTTGRGVEKGDEVNRELLNKALANGTPITFQSAESTSPRFPRFQSVESIGPGRRVTRLNTFSTRPKLASKPRPWPQANDQPTIESNLSTLGNGLFSDAPVLTRLEPAWYSHFADFWLDINNPAARRRRLSLNGNVARGSFCSGRKAVCKAAKVTKPLAERSNS